MTDEEKSYIWANGHFKAGHFSVVHSKNEFSRQGIRHDNYEMVSIHNNTAESYFSLLKRGFIGAFHRWSVQHLHRYAAEFDFRFSNRKKTDYERTVLAIQGVGNKRLMYDSLPTGSPWQ